MKPTHIVVGRMDSQRPGLVATLVADHLSRRRRLGRALGYGGAVMGIGLVISNFLLLMIPAPHIHVCSLPLALLLGPVVAIFTWRTRVIFAPGELACPRCAKHVTLPEKLGGWPARFNCVHCAIMIELNAAKENVTPP